MLKKPARYFTPTVILVTKSTHWKHTIKLVKCNFNIIYPIQVYNELLQTQVQWNITIFAVDYCKHFKTCVSTCKVHNIFFLNEKCDEHCLCAVYSSIYHHVSVMKKCVGKTIWNKLQIYFLELSRSFKIKTKKATDRYKTYLFILAFIPCG